MSPNVIVDDRDPNVHYGGPGWSRGGTALEFRNTATVSGSTGSTVTYTFNGELPRLLAARQVTQFFPGTAISVWGTIAAPMSSSASYSIDGDSPVTVATVIFSEDQVWENLFNWTSLQDGTHTITITTRSGIFSLDFLLVTPSPNASLGGATLMVDDMDPSIEWNPSSQWAAFGTVSCLPFVDVVSPPHPNCTPVSRVPEYNPRHDYGRVHHAVHIYWSVILRLSPIPGHSTCDQQAPPFP